jgi:hypothetical protein
MKVHRLFPIAFILVLILPSAPVDARYCLRRAGSIGQGRCDFSTRHACTRIAAASRATCIPLPGDFVMIQQGGGEPTWIEGPPAVLGFEPRVQRDGSNSSFRHTELRDVRSPSALRTPHFDLSAPRAQEYGRGSMAKPHANSAILHRGRANRGRLCMDMQPCHCSQRQVSLNAFGLPRLTRNPSRSPCSVGAATTLPQTANTGRERPSALLDGHFGLSFCRSHPWAT